MTRNNIPPRVVYAGSNAVSAYSFSSAGQSIPYRRSADFVVLERSADGVITQLVQDGLHGYTLAGVPLSSVPSVASRVDGNLPTGSMWSMRRQSALDQQSDFQLTADWDSSRAILTDTFDRTMEIIQEVNDKAERAMKLDYFDLAFQAGGKQIKGLLAGTDPSDAVTVNQMTSIAIDKTFSFAGLDRIINLDPNQDLLLIYDVSESIAKSLTFSQIAALFATAAQGAKADSAVQPADMSTAISAAVGAALSTMSTALSSAVTTLSNTITTAVGVLATPGASADASMAAAISAAAAASVPLVIPAGTYGFMGEVDFSPLLDGAGSIVLNGNVIFDFTAATNIANFTHGCHVYASAGALVALPNLSVNVALSDGDLTFSAAHGLVSGDRVCIYNPTDFSHSLWRYYYRAGEFVRVHEVPTATTVTLLGVTYAAYVAANVNVYKHPNKRLTVTGGSITIKENRNIAFANLAGARFEKIVDSDLSAFVPTQSGNAGIVLKQCVGIHGTGYKCRMQPPNPAGTAYGIVMANSQDVRIDGLFESWRHGATTGGYDDVGAVPCRNIHASGTFRNSVTNNTGAANFHGNSEFCSYNGVFLGGVSVAGNNNSVHGLIKSHDNIGGLYEGTAVVFTEMNGTNFKISGQIIVPTQGSQSYPVIDIGFDNTTALTGNTIYGGVLDFSGLVFEAPNSNRLISITNRGANAPATPIVVDVRGAKWMSTNITPVFALGILKTGTKGVDVVLMDGFYNGANAGYVMAAADVGVVRGWRQSGVVTVTPTTSVALITAAVAIKAPRVPKVALTAASANCGGVRAFPYIGSVSAASIAVGMATANAANFSLTTPADVHWTATVDE